jgi:hypothetical protein
VDLEARGRCTLIGAKAEVGLSVGPRVVPGVGSEGPEEERLGVGPGAEPGAEPGAGGCGPGRVW